MSRRPAQGIAFLVEDRPAEAFEQLDAALRIVTVRNWLLLAVVFLTLTAFGVFSWLYEAPLKVEGRGIILAESTGEGDPLLQVTAPAAGRLTRVGVKIGDTVEAGQVIAEIDQSELRDQIQEAEAELARLRDEDEQLTRFDETEEKSRDEALGRLEQTLRRNLQLDQGRLVVNRRVEAGDRSLNQRRLLSDGDALKSRAEADAVESKIGDTHARLQELTYQRLEDQTTRRREKLKRQLGILGAETNLGLLRDRLARDTRVISPYPGTVVDLMITPHALAEKGAPAALLRPHVRDVPPMEAIVFVPAGVGKKIRLGDVVQVEPDTVKRQEHGYIRGVVRSASEIPATEMAMLAELKHKSLVSSFVEQYEGQVLLCVHVDLLRARAPSAGAGQAPGNGLEWSSSSGAFQRIGNGTLCAAEVVVEKRPLITLAMPWVKHLMGID
jgi:HlyD family secretion protein